MNKSMSFSSRHKTGAESRFQKKRSFQKPKSPSTSSNFGLKAALPSRKITISDKNIGIVRHHLGNQEDEFDDRISQLAIQGLPNR